MKLVTLLAAIAGAALTTGCGPALSIHPLYTEQDLVSDLPLEGAWTDPDNDEVWRFTKSNDGYEVVEMKTGDAAQVAKYNVHLLRLREWLFLDIAPQAQPDLAIPGHMFAKVWMEGGDLRLVLLDEDWLKQMAEAGRAPQSVVGPAKQLILTAPTLELQSFVLANAADPKAFDETAGVLRRVR